MNNNFYEKDYYEISEEVYMEPKRKKILKPIIRFIASALAFGIISGAGFQAYNAVTYRMSEKEYSQTSQLGDNSSVNGVYEVPQIEGETATTISIPLSGGEKSTGAADIVENVMPSIVSITVASTVTDVFGRQFESEDAGSGSGIIVGQNDNEILIVTNNHVVAGSTKLNVTFDDESTAAAVIKGTDAKSDLAVIAVSLGNLSNDTVLKIKVATLGNSNNLRVGEPAIAIGNALGYGQSVTVGVISAINRDIEIDGMTMTLVQTDAAINPGNSGGALLDAQGAVIGINSVKFASSQVEGMGYAIPISAAIPIINDLMNREVIPVSEQAYLGIGGQAIIDVYASRFNMPMGYYISEIGTGSPAETYGLSVGDIIVSIDGITIEDETDIKEIMSYHRGGDVVEITCKVLSNGEYVEKTVEVTLGSRK